ncbi:MAG TPA: alternative ribosome rescue aminoacyl-tRNA hydrolase ArfB [Bacteroidales bacterium]|nr:alternative ribosome rescue aminoacyl-tRNA hydrolase ArfB [Bacteroidales bacterium]
MITTLTAEELRKRIPEPAFTFVASRSSGPGGQNVNKVNTKIELRFNIIESGVFSRDEEEILLARLGKRISKAGELTIRSQSQRTQSGNRNKAVEKLLALLAAALTENPERIMTLPTAKSVARRLDQKRRHSRIKQTRSNKDISGEAE